MAFGKSLLILQVSITVMVVEASQRLLLSILHGKNAIHFTTVIMRAIRTCRTGESVSVLSISSSRVFGCSELIQSTSPYERRRVEGRRHTCRSLIVHVGFVETCEWRSK